MTPEQEQEARDKFEALVKNATGARPEKDKSGGYVHPIINRLWAARKHSIFGYSAMTEKERSEMKAKLQEAHGLISRAEWLLDSVDFEISELYASGIMGRIENKIEELDQ